MLNYFRKSPPKGIIDEHDHEQVSVDSIMGVLVNLLWSGGLTSLVEPGELFGAPIVRETISTPRMIISGRFTQEEALCIVNGIKIK